MSASMYNSPYTYKEPLPPIEYPPMFSGLKRISFKHIFDSKFLALAAVLFLIAILIVLICIISPFWFKLVFSTQDGTFGTEAVKRKLSIDTGIFFLNDEQFDNLADVDKLNNQDTVPKLVVLAQILSVTGVCLLVACLAGCVILVFRKFSSATANFFLAFFSTLAGVCLVLVFVCALVASFMSSCDPYDTGSSCEYKDNLKWRLFPVYTQFFRMESMVTPYIKLNWTAYISIIAGVVTLGGAVMAWLEALTTYRKLSQIRYTQLRTARSPYEGDVNPMDHGKYVYRPPVMSGPLSYGMQPVAFQGGPYGVAHHQPPPSATPSFSVGFQDHEPRRGVHSSSSSPPASRRRASPPPRRRSPSPPSRSPSPPSDRRYSPPSRRRSPPPSRRRSPSPPSRRGPPSMNSSMSEGPNISREIDL